MLGTTTVDLTDINNAILALQNLTAQHTNNITALDGRTTLIETGVTALQTLTEDHTTDIETNAQGIINLHTQVVTEVVNLNNSTTEGRYFFTQLPSNAPSGVSAPVWVEVSTGTDGVFLQKLYTLNNDTYTRTLNTSWSDWSKWGGGSTVISGWNVKKYADRKAVINISKTLTLKFNSSYGNLWKPDTGKITLDFPTGLFVDAPICTGAVVTNFEGMGGISIDKLTKDDFQFWVYNGNIYEAGLSLKANFEFEGNWK